MRLLYGNYAVTIDEKNRMLVPAEIRRAIDPAVDGEAFFLVPGVNGKLWLYCERLYEQMSTGAPTEMNPDDSQNDRDHMNFGQATRIEPDKQGRLVIPERDLADNELGREVSVVGVRDHIEIWNREEYRQYAARLNQKRAEVALKGKAAQSQPGLAARA